MTIQGISLILSENPSHCHLKTIVNIRDSPIKVLVFASYRFRLLLTVFDSIIETIPSEIDV